MSFPRPLYHTQYTQFLHTDLIKVFVGQRRVGKSSLLQTIMHDLRAQGDCSDANTLRIDKESFERNHITTATQLHELAQTYQ